MKALVLVGCVALVGCGEMDSGLPPVGTTWEECPAGGAPCVTHRIGLAYDCTITGSLLEQTNPSVIEDASGFTCIDDRVAEAEYEEEMETWACEDGETVDGELPEDVCIFDCVATGGRCDLAEL